ncbi:MAG: transposase [Verrucomicrobiota bacterium]|nr:transposase [Verrucomicrobiota bacterium]
MKTNIHIETDMNTNTHDQNLTTIPGSPQATNPLCDRILLGIDQHAADLRIVRQLDGAGTQPPQRIYPGLPLERFIKKQFTQAKQVFAVSEAGPCGFGLARQLQAWGVIVYVIRPMKLDSLGKGVNTDKTDAAELVSRLDRYLAGNRKAFAVVRVPTPEEEQRRCVSRQREQLRRERQRLEAMGRSLMLAQGHRVKGHWWQTTAWARLSTRLPAWLLQRLDTFRSVIESADQQLTLLTQAVVAQAGQARPIGLGPLTLVSATNEVGHWGRFNNRKQVGSLTGLCGGVSSSGQSHLDLSITKHGNPRLRYLLIELAWRRVRFQPQCRAVQKWKHILLTHGTHGRKRKQAIVALARQLAVDLWRWQTGRVTPAQLGWKMA